MRPKHSLNHNIKSVPLVLTGNTNTGFHVPCAEFNSPQEGIADEHFGRDHTALSEHIRRIHPTGGKARLHIEVAGCINGQAT